MRRHWILIVTTNVVFSTLLFYYVVRSNDRKLSESNIRTSHVQDRGVFSEESMKANQTTSTILLVKPSLDDVCNEIKYETHNLSQIPPRLQKNMAQPQTFPLCGVGSLLRPHKVSIDKNWMFIVIKSAPKNLILRELIRRSWASIIEINGRNIAAIFLLGRTDETQEWLLQTENEHYGDILQCDVVLSTFQWTISSGIDSTFFTFCDDDIVINLVQLYKYFPTELTIGTENHIVCEYKVGKDHKTIRGYSKWAVSTDLYPYEHYPTFCHGAMYTVSTAMLHKIFCTARVTNSTDFQLDDVFLTGISRYKITGTNEGIDWPMVDGKKQNLMFYKYGEGIEERFHELLAKWGAWKKEVENFEIVKRNL